MSAPVSVTDSLTAFAWMPVNFHITLQTKKLPTVFRINPYDKMHDDIERFNTILEIYYNTMINCARDPNSQGKSKCASE